MTRVGLVLATSIVAGCAGSAIVSTSYWGFPFARPSMRELAKVTRVVSVTPLESVRQGTRCTFETSEIQDLRRYVAGFREHIEDFPTVRPLVVLQDRGVLPASAHPPEWLAPERLHQAVVDTGILVTGEAGPQGSACIGGYAIEVNLSSGEWQLLLAAGGDQISNDHYPYYEVVFRREKGALVPERTRVAFYDIAGLEVFEWPLLHILFVAAALLMTALGAVVLLAARDLARWIEGRRPTKSCT